jgi:uncharacterized coiled-coil protein SlyX
MSKQKHSVAPPPMKISIPDAVLNLARRIKGLEDNSMSQLKAIEEKLGDHENRFIEDAPDMDQIAEMFKLMGSKIDVLTERLIEVEKRNDIKHPKKKGGTVKLAELGEDQSGISFS